MVSLSIQIGLSDRRIRYWAKKIPSGLDLPLPEKVQKASDIPTYFLLPGDEELFEGDFLIEAIQVKPYKPEWKAYVSWMNPETGERITVIPDSSIETMVKANGLNPKYLAGSGYLAACIRVVHAVREGVGICMT